MLMYFEKFLECIVSTAKRLTCLTVVLSLDSYIKPQPQLRRYDRYDVVYLLIPTSNHNSDYEDGRKQNVVYLLIPTSNHNDKWLAPVSISVVYLLIPTSNHNFC